MSDEPVRPRGFVLAPSRLARPSLGDDEKTAQAAKPLFSGLKASKLGVLTESNLKPPSGAIHAGSVTSPEAANGTAVSEKTEEKCVESATAPAVKPASFSFKPLSKVDKSDIENGEKSKDTSEPANDSDKGFVFGHKLANRTENVGSAAAVFGEKLSDRALTPSKPSAGPVFGENLSDRVVNSEPGDVNGSEEQKDKIPDVTSPEKDVVPSTDAPPLPSATTPTKENMFFSTAATATPGKEIVPQNQDESSSKKSLSEAAAEYTESHSNKRKYDEVAVVTGEEEESNVLKMNVKLYLFDSDSRNWTERGRGMLRLNDAPASTPGHLKSRLVMRTSGSLRVVLNTKLWPEMICQRPNEKSLRISAMDGDIARVFLISASPKDTDKLFTALEYRLSQLKTDKAESEEPPEKKAALDD